MAYLGFDLDGVIYNFVKSLREFIYETKGRALDTMPDAESWNFFEDQWGLTKKQYYSLVVNGIKYDGFLRTGDQISGSKAALEYIANIRKDKIVIVTARNYHGIESISREATLHWLEENEIPFDDLIMTHNKTGFNFDAMFDDAPHNIEALVESGENPIIFHQAWNAHETIAPRVYGWDGVLNYLEENFPISIDKSISMQ